MVTCLRGLGRSATGAGLAPGWAWLPRRPSTRGRVEVYTLCALRERLAKAIVGGVEPLHSALRHLDLPRWWIQGRPVLVVRARACQIAAASLSRNTRGRVQPCSRPAAPRLRQPAPAADRAQRTRTPGPAARARPGEQRARHADQAWCARSGAAASGLAGGPERAA